MLQLQSFDAEVFFHKKGDNMSNQKKALKGIRFKEKIKRYEARISINKQHLSKTFKTEGEAVAWFKSQNDSRNSECHLTCGDIFPAWIESLEHEYSQQTVRKYARDTRLHIEPVFKNIKLKNIDAKILIDFVIKLRKREHNGKPITLKTVLNVVWTFWNFFNYCSSQTYLEYNPIESEKFRDYRSKHMRLKNQKAKNRQNIQNRTRNEEEIKQLIMESYKREYEFGFGVEFLLGVGNMRLGEISALTWGDIKQVVHNKSKAIYFECVINKTRDHVTRNIQKGAKSGSNRTVVIESMLIDKLRIWKQMAQDTGYGVSNSDTLFPLIARNQKLFSSHIGELSKKAKIRHTTAHPLRNSSISYLGHNGHNLQEVQKSAGHSDVRMTQGYFDAFGLGTENMAKTIEGLLIPTDKLGFCQNLVPILNQNT